MSRNPCAGSKEKEASDCHPVSLNLRAGCRHTGGCLREQHYMLALLLYSSQAHTFSRQVAYMGLWLNSLQPPQEGMPAVGRSAEQPPGAPSLWFPSPSPRSSLCSLYAWVSFERISALERHGMQAHVLPAWCQDTERDSPEVGL